MGEEYVSRGHAQSIGSVTSGQSRTPGPWAVTEAWGGQPGEPLALCFHEIRADGKTIASTWSGPHEADAHLIAAAPDLLAALKGVVAVADRQTVEFDAARAAISKAEPVDQSACAASDAARQLREGQ